MLFPRSLEKFGVPEAADQVWHLPKSRWGRAEAGWQLASPTLIQPGSGGGDAVAAAAVLLAGCPDPHRAHRNVFN